MEIETVTTTIKTKAVKAHEKKQQKSALKKAKRIEASRPRVSTTSTCTTMSTVSEDLGIPPSPTISEASMLSWDTTSPPRLTPQVSILNDLADNSTVTTSNYDWPLTSSEKLLSKYAIKTDLSNCHRRLDNAFPLLSACHGDTIQHGIDIIKQVVTEAWKSSEGQQELVGAVCKYLQKSGNLDLIVQLFISGQYDMRLQVGKVLEAYLSNGNATYIIQRGYLRDLIKTVIVECDKKDEPHVCLGMSLLESFFRNGVETCKIVVELGGLDYLLDVCRTQIHVEALLHAAVALSNLAVFSDFEVQRLMVKKQVPVWLFVLATHDDKRVQFYGCLTSCIIASNKEFERTVREAGTLEAAAIYMKSTKADDMAKLDYKYRCGRSKEWLSALLPLLSSTVPEVQAMALYQLLMEASLRKGTERIEALFQVLEELGLTAKIQEIASCPTMDLVGSYAENLLMAMGEPVPYKLCLSVPLWTCKEVQYWVRKVGFAHFVECFAKHRVDGYLLLRTTEEHLKNEIKMTSGYERMRFVRELHSMKRSADYSSVDPTRLDMWLTRLDPEFSIYTYQMLSKGLDRHSLIHVDDQCLKEVCGMDNKIHRMKLLHSLREVKHVEEAELALLKKQIDIFISYRRATGSQLASLLKVHLQLKGFKVFIDVDRLNAGQFDKSLLLNIKAAKHFILVLTPHALDACIGDNDCKDWVHLEIKTALEAKANIIPVVEKGFDWPQVHSLPNDMQPACAFNAIQWVHEYQEACIDKLHRFLSGQAEPIQTTPPPQVPQPSLAQPPVQSILV